MKYDHEGNIIAEKTCVEREREWGKRNREKIQDILLTIFADVV